MNFLSQQLMFSKVTEVIPEDIGATAFTIFAVVKNFGIKAPTSIGLKIADVVSENRFFQLVRATLFVQFVVICFLFRLAVEVDEAKIEEFGIEAGREQEEGIAVGDSDALLLE